MKTLVKSKRKEIRDEENPPSMAGERLFCLDDLLKEAEGNMDDNGLQLLPGYYETYKKNTFQTQSPFRMRKKEEGVYT